MLVLSACRQQDNDGPDGDDEGRDSADSVTEGPPYAVPLSGCYYYRTAGVTVGGQAFQLSIDSGSATMAVSATGCTSCEDDGVVELYDTAHGTDEGRTASCRYDQGQMGWDGDVYGDDVAMGDLPAVNMRFAAVSDQDYMFGSHSCDGDDDVPVDGILGLRQDSTLSRGTDSYLSTVVSEESVPDSFALHLCHTGGTLWLGGYDANETTGEMSFVPFASSTSYSVDVTTFEVVSQSGWKTEAPVAEDGDAVAGLLDSGGPHLLVPPFAYDVIVEAISSDPAFSELGNVLWWEGSTGTSLTLSPTELDAMLPRLVVNLAGDPAVRLSLPASESYLQWEAKPAGKYDYWPNIISYDFLDLGNLPMFSYVVYTDRAEERIGFAPAVPCP